MRFRMTPALLPLAVALVFSAALPAETLSQKVDPWVLEKSAAGPAEFLVMLRSQADLRGASSLGAKSERGAFVMDTLRSLAERSQRPLLDLLAERGVPHRAYWVANMIWVRGDLRLVEELAAREDVFHVYANPRVRLDGPVSSAPSSTDSPDAIEWGVMKVHAPEVWAQGHHGEGVVVGGQDTGYEWDHAAIKNKYRGWSGSAADHNYNWHDSIHSGGGVCGPDSPEPCDDHSHGTHTMGTMVGDDGGSNQIGVAPGARWIGCRNMDVGVGTPATYSECFQWFIAPTNLQNQNPDPTKAPHVINNSWGCPPSEGCTDPAILQAVVEATRAAGIEVVVSAGNAGSSCETVADPPAIYEASFSVGATDSGDNIAGFSSRGPVTIDGSGRLKPDVSAPGVGVRSSVPGGGYAFFDGTSMAGPHVVGIVALLLSANPDLIGDPDAIEPLLTGSAVPRTSSQTCGGVPGSEIPNNTYGWGRADALAAVLFASADLELTQTDAPDPTLVGVPVSYTLTIANHGPTSAAGVTLSEGLSLSASVDSATPSQGNCTVLTHGASCDLGSIPSGGSATVVIVGTPSAEGTLTSNASVDSSGVDPDESNNAAPIQTTVSACPFATPTIGTALSVPAETSGLTASTSSGEGHALTWALTGGVISDGQGTRTLTFESGAPGTTMLLELTDVLGSCEVVANPVTIAVNFSDVPFEDIFRPYINTVLRHGITGGCGGGNYCPDDSVTRGQMAAFLLKGKYGAAHTPPPATGTVFADVPAGHPFAAWIEELSALGITGGCGGGNYCPEDAVTRAQMSAFLLKTKEGSGHAPPPAAGIFDDVPLDHLFAAWIEELHARGITGGCNASPMLYCPSGENTREQMAVFLVKTFDLQ
jgi:subtilisin family serine protease